MFFLHSSLTAEHFLWGPLSPTHRFHWRWDKHSLLLLFRALSLFLCTASALWLFGTTTWSSQCLGCLCFPLLGNPWRMIPAYFRPRKGGKGENLICSGFITLIQRPGKMVQLRGACFLPPGLAHPGSLWSIPIPALLTSMAPSSQHRHLGLAGWLTGHAQALQRSLAICTVCRNTSLSRAHGPFLDREHDSPSPCHAVISTSIQRLRFQEWTPHAWGG